MSALFGGHVAKESDLQAAAVTISGGAPGRRKRDPMSAAPAMRAG